MYYTWLKNKAHSNFAHMKILFIQLPLNSHASDYIPGNIEYAPAVISSFLKKNFKAIDGETLPALLSGFASDTTIIKYINEVSPDIISFSCYLWNIERHLYLARRIKSLFPKIDIIFGGPEITIGSIALQEEHPAVSFFVSGEGEWFFKKYLQKESLSCFQQESMGNRLIIQPQDELLPVDAIVEPFTSRELNIMPDGSIYLELTRGCPYRCSYCYYSKQCRTVRELPFEILLSALNSGRDINEIYLLSPTFDASPDFLKRLEKLRDLRHGVSLHTELRAGKITSKTAKLLYEGGFQSLEVGLQTMSPVSLQAVLRNSNPEKELEGIIHLAEAGIDLKIGIIPGLPYENVDSFRYTVDTLLSKGMEDFIELYPLMLLPGTAIRERAVKENIASLQQPPYFYLDGWGMSFEDIYSISRYVEEATGLSQSSFSLPGFSLENDNGLTSACFIQTEGLPVWKSQEIIASIETSLFSFHICLNNVDQIMKGLCLLMDRLPPHHLFNLIFYSDGLVDEKRLYREIKKFDSNSFNRRLNLFISEDEGLSIRCFHVTEKIESYIHFNMKYTMVEPIIKVNKANIHQLEKYINSEETNPSLLVSTGTYACVKNLLYRIYRELPELVAFENEKEQEEWYNDIAMDHVTFPYRFRKVHL